MCIAAYVALITGAGISLQLATRLRLALLFLCLSALTFVAARTGARLLKGRQRKASR
jgi:hypothetical protein